MPSKNLPVEIWYRILKLCRPSDVTLVCHSWTQAAHSIPSLWTDIQLRSSQFTIEGLALFEARIIRAKRLPLDVHLHDDFDYNDIFYGVCFRLFSSFTIHKLHVVPRISSLSILSLMLMSFHDSPARLELQNFILEVDYSDLGGGIETISMLPMRGLKFLRGLRSLTLPALRPCFTFPSNGVSFDLLTTLVITQSLMLGPTGLHPICRFLLLTPNLETLWCKTPDINSGDEVQGLTAINSTHDSHDPIPIPIILPRLTNVSVTVPGTGGDILSCIDAPALRDLHLDGSRSSYLSDIHWSISSENDFQYTLRHVATHSPQLRRLAITEAVLSEETWHWLLSGDGEEQTVGDNHVPFPHLETLAVRDFCSTRSCGLDDAVLSHYAGRLGLKTLKRLVLRECERVSGDALVSTFLALRGTIEDNNALELEIVVSPGSEDTGTFEDRHLLALESHGIRVKLEVLQEDSSPRSHEAQREWWDRHLELIELSDDDCEEEVRFEDPWWILKIECLDPSDRRMF